MKFKLLRTRFDESGVYGKFLKADGGVICYTLEHSYGCAPKLPDGVYKCVRGQHRLHSGPIETFEIVNVPGHKGILLHPGNTEADSDGCVLLGMDIVGDALVYSRHAFNLFLKAVEKVNEFELIVSSTKEVDCNHY